jgi:hypothetical protein
MYIVLERKMLLIYRPIERRRLLAFSACNRALTQRGSLRWWQAPLAGRRRCRNASATRSCSCRRSTAATNSCYKSSGCPPPSSLPVAVKGTPTRGMVLHASSPPPRMRWWRLRSPPLTASKMMQGGAWSGMVKLQKGISHVELFWNSFFFWL